MIQSPRKFLCEFLLAGALLLVGWTYVSDLYLELLLGGVTLVYQRLDLSALWRTDRPGRGLSGCHCGGGPLCSEFRSFSALASGWYRGRSDFALVFAGRSDRTRTPTGISATRRSGNSGAGQGLDRSCSGIDVVVRWSRFADRIQSGARKPAGECPKEHICPCRAGNRLSV